MNKKLIASAVALLVMPMVALAAENFVVTVINNFLTMVIWPIFLGLVIIMFIWAGILYLTARGDPEKFKKANLAVVFAIVGIIVAILGYRIVATLRNIIPDSGGAVACTTSADCTALGMVCYCPDPNQVSCVPPGSGTCGE